MNTEAIMTAFDREPTEIKLKDLDYKARPFNRWVIHADAENRSGRFWITMTVKDTPKVFDRKWLLVNLTVAQIDDKTSQIKEIAYFSKGQKLSGCGADAAAAEFAAQTELDLTKMRLKRDPAWTLLFLQAKEAADLKKLYAAQLEHARKVAITLGNEVHRLRGEKPYDEIHALLYNP